MTPDDPRHGTPAGSHAGCKDDCCRLSRNRYERNRRKLREAGHPSPMVDATGTRRRVQALMTLGWPAQAIADTAGITRGQSAITRLIHESRTVHRDTSGRIGRAYDELSMKVGPSPITRVRAQRNGWLPPLAWDDGLIDDPNHDPRRRRPPSPRGTRRERVRPTKMDQVDEAVVIRVLSGEQLPTTTAERAEIVRRWMATGRSEAELCKITGWRGGRYVAREDEAS